MIVFLYVIVVGIYFFENLLRVWVIYEEGNKVWVLILILIFFFWINIIILVGDYIFRDILFKVKVDFLCIIE